ncbi:MAG: 3-deoxy-manno-octulosonate cytidylyltransferase [bacterium]|nr:3-deoxy-manno-octulosonate cytidylyltransferase [bacterium]
MKVLIVIPSRYGSTRFEGKPLIDIQGKSLVQRTYLQATKAKLHAKVVVATDDEKIYEHVSGFGECIMTSANHISGTDRCFEVADVLNYDFDVLINLQGDEPFILPEQIEALAAAFDNPAIDIATLKKFIRTEADLFNPNMVKVICDGNDQAIYFSRHAIPYLRGVESAEWVNKFGYYRHVGMYAFKREAISKLKDLQASGLELAESLEQLRWLENGFKIKVLKTEFVSPAIDTPADLRAVENFLKSNPELI